MGEPSANFSTDRLIATARKFSARGFTAVKLTGGDPALHPDLEAIVRRLRCEAHFTDIEVISRHPRLATCAETLASVGITMFNMSIDTLDPRTHHAVCGIDDHAEVLQALFACIKTGVPCKVNIVVMKGVNDHEIHDLVRYFDDVGVKVVKLLDVIQDLDHGRENFSRRLKIKTGKTLRDLYIPTRKVLEAYSPTLEVDNSSNGSFGHPMSRVTLPSGMVLMAKDSRAGAWYGNICDGCRFYPCHDALMAIRISPSERIQTCLLGDTDLGGLSVFGTEMLDLDQAIDSALAVYKSARFEIPTSLNVGETALI